MISLLLQKPSTDPENPQSTIIHIDIDCYYYQGEMVADPTQVDRHLRIQQKNI